MTNSHPARRTDATRPGNHTHRPRPQILTAAEVATIKRAIDALPPLTDEQIDALCEVITNARATWRAANARPAPNKLASAT